MDSKLVKEKLLAAEKLFSGPTTTIQKFHAARSLLKGIDPKLDTLLEECAKPIVRLEKMQNLEVVELSAEAIPETTEEEKKRKKYVLLFIRNLKKLRDEIKRVNSEIDQAEKSHGTHHADLKAGGRILGNSAGPFGLVTVAAVLVVAGWLLWKHSQNIYKPTQKASTLAAPAPSNEPRVRGIIYNGKSIPLSALYIGSGPDCGGGGVPHYHAIGEVAIALDGTKIPDPGGCGFGKVSAMTVIDIPR